MTRKRTLKGSSAAIVLLVLLLAASIALANGVSKPGAGAGVPLGGESAAGAGAPGAAGQAYPGAAGGPPVSTARFTLEFVDAELIDVFQALAMQSGVNIAVSGSVTGKTTLRLRNVTLDQALKIVTKLNGLDYAWVEAAYVVGTPEEVQAMRVADLRTSVVVLQHIQPEHAQQVLGKLTPEVTVSAQKGVRSVLLLGTEDSLAKAERALAEIDVPPIPGPPTSEIVPVRYLKADQMAAMINAAVPEAIVQPGPQENSLVVTADALQWEAIRSLIAASDAAPPPAQATRDVYYVKYLNASQLMDALVALVPDLRVTLAPITFTPSVTKPTGGAGGTAQMLSAPQFAASTGGGGATTADEIAPVNALILSGAPYTVEQGMALAAQLDTAPSQVHIQAMVTEVRREDITRLGIDWGPTVEAGLGGTGVPFVIGEAIPAGAPTGGIPARGLEVGKIERSFLQWSASIRALEEQGRARVLSSPSVTVLDGRQTSLHTGETYYYEVAVAAATTGIVNDVRTFDVGITLSVTPRVNDDETVTLSISPGVAALQGTSEFDLPVVTERTVMTTVRVGTGETAVIAGLITDEEQVTVKKVPLLGDIPLLGELFKHRERRPAHREILVFVTPTIVEA
jgi:type II secretion system protein D